MSDSSPQNRKHNQKQKEKQAGRWTKDEHLLFLSGLQQFGKNWKKIETIVQTRNGSQIRSHAQKYFNKLPNSSTPVHSQQCDFKQQSVSQYQPSHLHEHESRSYPPIDCPIGLPSLHFVFSDKGIPSSNLNPFDIDETSMDQIGFHRPMEEIQIEIFNTNRSALFIDIIEDSKKNKDQSFMKMYVDVGNRSCIKGDNNGDEKRKKTSFVKFKKEVERREFEDENQNQREQ